MRVPVGRAMAGTYSGGRREEPVRGVSVGAANATAWVRKRSSVTPGVVRVGGTHALRSGSRSTLGGACATTGVPRADAPRAVGATVVRCLAFAWGGALGRHHPARRRPDDLGAEASAPASVSPAELVLERAVSAYIGAMTVLGSRSTTRLAAGASAM